MGDCTRPPAEHVENVRRSAIRMLGHLDFITRHSPNGCDARRLATYAVQELDAISTEVIAVLDHAGVKFSISISTEWEGES